MLSVAKNLCLTVFVAILWASSAHAQMAIEPQLNGGEKAAITPAPIAPKPDISNIPPVEVAKPAAADNKPTVPTDAKTPAGAAATPPTDAPPGKAAASQPEAFSSVQLQGLNKVTARISTIEAPLGTTMRFGNLEIVALACWQAPPEEKPENAALLKIFELKPGEIPAQIFYGWMFSSSPALSALEHPVYDVTVLQCQKTGDPDSAK